MPFEALIQQDEYAKRTLCEFSKIKLKTLPKTNSSALPEKVAQRFALNFQQENNIGLWSSIKDLTATERLIFQHKSLVNPEHIYWLSPETEHEWQKATRLSNRKTAELIGLDLKPYGYT